MKVLRSLILGIAILGMFYSCTTTNPNLQVLSPNGNVKVEVFQKEAITYYQVFNKDNLVIKSSAIGVSFADRSFYKNLIITGSTQNVIDEDYTMLTGKQLQNNNHANELVVSLENESKQTIDLVVRAYDDGAALRYEINGEGELTATSEQTQFHVNPNGVAWMQNYDWWSPAYEQEFKNKIRIGTVAPQHGEDGWSYPALFNTENTWLLITEAGLDRNYCATHIRNEDDSSVYEVKFAIKEQGYKGGIKQPKVKLPWKSPWRVMMMGDLATVFESNLVHHVSESSKVENTDWIKPGSSAWSWLFEPDSPKDYIKLKKYVDLSVEMNWKYCLVDANWNMMKNGNIEQLVNYANDKNVGLILWYNSGGPNNDVTEQPRDILNNPELRLKEFEKLQKWGVKGMKVDFFQSDKQDIIQLYIDILEDAAKYNLLVNFHGCTLPRGWAKTYPHLVTMEAVKGNEFYLLDGSFTYNAGRHNAILPFTRNIVGSMDYTPVTFSNNVIPHVTTPGHELALTVVFESGVIHFGDKAEAYFALPETIKQYLREVPSAWDETKLLSGYPGKHCIVARRSGNDWYIAGINGYFEPMKEKLDLSFIGDEEFEGIFIQTGRGDEMFEINNISTDELTELEVNLVAEDGFVLKLIRK